MNANVDDLPVTKGLKVLAAVLVGLGLGTALKGTVALPAVGTVPGLAAGGPALLVGGALYTQAPALSPAGTASSCGCDGDCGCS